MIQSATVTRESADIGKYEVAYSLELDSENFIQKGSYAEFSIPQNEIQLVENDFICRDM